MQRGVAQRSGNGAGTENEVLPVVSTLDLNHSENVFILHVTTCV